MMRNANVVKSGLLTLLAALPLLVCPLVAQAQGEAAQVARNIHVDLSHVDPGLPCAVVGERTHVRFDARAVAFHPTRVVVLLNGTPAPGEQVRYAWPEVTLDGGLLAGRNTVELIVHRKKGPPIERRIVIKVGDSVHSSDGITLGCTGVEDDSAAVVSSVVPPPTTTTIVEYRTPPAVVYPVQPAYVGWPYTVGYGYPRVGTYYGGFYNAWAPAALSVGVGLAWGHAWGGWPHRWHRGWYGHGHRHWHGGHHWHRHWRRH